MDVKDLQKTAHLYRKQVTLRRGVIDPQAFAHNVLLECYEPSADMLPFVRHYYIARRVTHGDTTYDAKDVLTQPVINLLLTQEASLITGVTSGTRTLRLGNNAVYAGVRFRPGGFHPFWEGRVAELTDRSMAASRVFPVADLKFARQLLTLDDQSILAALESLLRSKQPRATKSITFIGQVLARIEADRTLRTMQDVAHAFNRSERSLQSLFKTYVGVGVKWFLMRTRFIEAIQQARTHPKPSWTEIAANLGYSTQSHFINDFKKIMGQSPSQYSKTTA
jgi:AraC-like DNA-binding protein